MLFARDSRSAALMAAPIVFILPVSSAARIDLPRHPAQSLHGGRTDGVPRVMASAASRLEHRGVVLRERLYHTHDQQKSQRPKHHLTILRESERSRLPKTNRFPPAITPPVGANRRDRIEKVILDRAQTPPSGFVMSEQQLAVFDNGFQIRTG